jgi:Ca-activated chloride channel family protein
MKLEIVARIRRHRHVLLRSAVVLAAATACAALVVGSRTVGARPPAGPRGAPQHVAPPPARRAAPPSSSSSASAAGGHTSVRWGGDVHGTLALSHGAVPAGGASTLFATLGVGADPLPTDPRRGPVSIVLVVDRSGSMGGDKIEDAKRAAAALVGALRPDDGVALVAYSDRAEVLVELAPVRVHRAGALSAIGRLEAGGGTAIAAGLEAGLAQLTHDASDRVRRIVLLSDGQDTSGADPASIVAAAERARAAGASVSTVGIGTDYDEPTMTRIADASRGNYHYLRDSSALAGVLSRELGEMATTVARDVVAEVELPAGIDLVRVTGADATQSGRVVRLSFGALFGGDERRAVLELTARPARVGGLGAVGARIAWQDRATGRLARSTAPRIDLVATNDARTLQRLTDSAALEEGLEVAAVARHELARSAWEAGDAARLRAIEEDNIRQLEAANATIGSGGIAAQVREYRSALQGMLSTTSVSEEGRDLGRRVTVSNRERSARDNGEGTTW